MATTRLRRCIRAWIYVSFFKMLSTRQLNAIRLLVFLLALLPAVWLCYASFADLLGANPIEYLTRSTGDWALYMLIFTLSITPIRKITQWNWLIRLRRMLGLYSFFYASLHLVCFIWFDHFFEWREMMADVFRRPFIWMGLLTWLSMLPLAMTSPKFMLRLLGGKRWQWLHRLVYGTAVMALFHYFWMKAGKHDFTRPGLFAAIVAGLLLYRVLKVWRDIRAQAQN